MLTYLEIAPLVFFDSLFCLSLPLDSLTMLDTWFFEILPRFFPWVILEYLRVFSLEEATIWPTDRIRSKFITFFFSSWYAPLCMVSLYDSSSFFEPLFSFCGQDSVLQISKGKKSFSTKSVYSRRLSLSRCCGKWGKKVL